MAVQQQGKLCIHHQLDNGIQEFIFTESSRAAVDEWIRHLERIYQESLNLPADSPGRTLIDVRQSGAMPLSYFFQRSRQFTSTHPSPAGSVARVAGLHDANGVIVSLVQSFANLGSRDMTVAFFKGDQRDQAIAWLLNGEK